MENTPTICKLIDRTQPIAVFANQLVNVSGGEAPKPTMRSRYYFSWLTTSKVATTERIEQPFNGGPRVVERSR